MRDYDNAEAVPETITSKSNRMARCYPGMAPHLRSLHQVPVEARHGNHTNLVALRSEPRDVMRPFNHVTATFIAALATACTQAQGDTQTVDTSQARSR
jgi:hypothetical protein